MRKSAALVFGLGAAAMLLAACGKKSEEAVMPSSAPLETSAAPASAAPALTPDQQKMLAALPAPYNTADPAAGEAKFAQCRACHSIAKGAPNLTGPNLYGVFGQKAAEVAGFSFSDEMKASGMTWDAPTLDKWIENPKAVLPNTKMTFLGLKDPKDRQDVVAYVALQRDK
jgi:cytochrome c